MSFTADLIEQAALSIFQKPGWRYEDPANLASDGPDKRRASSGEVVLSGLLQQTVRRINPHSPLSPCFKISGLRHVFGGTSCAERTL